MAKLSLMLLALIAPMGSNAFSVSNSESVSPDISRRTSISKAFGVLAGSAGIAATLPSVALAVPEEETARITARMGGLLERYQDSTRGLSLMVPSGWNKFEGEVGAYDLKWQDLVDQTENIKISSTPVKSTTTSINALGEDVKVIGESLAAKRNASLVKAEERLTDGTLYYTFEFAINDGTHQLLSLCVAKGKLWSVDASAKESRWAKRKEQYANVLGSFAPTLR